MSIWTFDPFEDGQYLTASELETGRFNSARLWIDSTDPDGWSKGMFNHRQAANPIRVPGTFMVRTDESGEHVYDETTFGTSIQYAGYGSNGGTMTTASYTGDRVIIGHPDQTGAYTGPMAHIDFSASPFKLGMNNEIDQSINASCIQVDLNVEIVDIDPASETNVQVMVCIQYLRSGSSTWWTIEESERFLSNDNRRIAAGVDSIFYDVPITCLITPAVIDRDGDSTLHDIQEIRAMISKYSSGGTGNVVITLGQWNMTAMVFRAKDVS